MAGDKPLSLVVGSQHKPAERQKWMRLENKSGRVLQDSGQREERRDETQ